MPWVTSHCTCRIDGAPHVKAYAMTDPSSDTDRPKTLDWFILTVITIIGGSSFAMIRGAVDTIPPILVALGRMWVGAFVIFILMKSSGRHLPALFENKRGSLGITSAWKHMIAIGVVGTTIPFFIFPWAQQYIDSGLAGIYMAFMPVWTLALAFFFTDETITTRKLVGFAAGLVGAIVLIGHDAISDAATTSLLPQLSILLATLLYATTAILVRRAPTIRPRIFAAGTLLSSAVFATPGLLFVEIDPQSWSMSSLLSLVGLGIGPTGLASYLIIILIKRTSASFMALANYVTPFCAVAMGALLFNERLALQSYIALAIILAGVAFSQSRSRPKQRQK